MTAAQDEDRLAFAGELEEVALQLSLLDPGMDPVVQREQVDAEYERLSMTAALYGWPDMEALIEWGRAALEDVSAPDLLAAGKFFGWLEMSALLLREPDDLAHLPMLTMELMDEAWPRPVPPDLLQRFLLSLRGAPDAAYSSVAESGNDDEAMTGQARAAETVAGTALAFASDVHPELLAAYLEETPGHITEAARLIRLIAIGAGNAEQKRQASRLVHTIKGSSGVVGVEAIAGFTHRLEDLLDLPIKVLPEGLGTTLEAAADCLESMFDQLQAGQALPDEYARLHAELADWIRQLADQAGAAKDGGTDKLEESLISLTALPDFLHESADEGAGVSGAEGAVSGLGEERIQRLLSLSGELITSSSQSAELLQQAGRLSKQLYQQDEQILQHLDELDSLIGQQAGPSGQSSLGGAAHPELDELEMESYSDLYSAASLLTEAAADSRQLVQSLQQVIRQLTEELYQQQRVQRQLSDTVLATRLTPVGSMMARMERIVRETCRKTGKKAEIFVQGQHLQVDADILKGMTDPLLHLLRNAVDHGIESPEARQAAGKDETGRISLSFTRRGNHISLLLEDDGAGMDVERIRQRAIQRGLIEADSEMPEDSLLRLVLQPGFSTRDEVSEVSGRGVGMDVVQSAIQQMRGVLSLQTERGVGSRISIDLPQTLTATHALVVRTGGNLVAVPADTIEQLLYVAADENHVDEHGWRIETSRYQLPVIQLAHVLHWPAAEVTIHRTQTLMIVRSEAQTYAFYVEEIFPSRDIVVKSLAPWLNHVPGVQGACILATGQVAPVLDMIRLLHELETGSLQPRQVGSEQAARPVRPYLTLLVVDDSLSNRQALRLMLEGMGYGVVTAVDGLDALQVMNGSRVDMILTDLEMPRMNGLELTRAVRIWPEMAYLPVLMITSRGTRKHRDMAQQAGVDGYLTKPVSSTVLQEQVKKWLDA